MKDCISQGRTIPDELVAPMRDSAALLADAPALRARLEKDGYLFLRNALDRDEVAAARREVFQRLAEVGEIAPPAEAGVFTGASRRRETVDDLGRFWRSVSEGPALRRVSHGSRLAAIMEKVFGEAAVPFDFLYLRAGSVGRATGLHCDYPFFTRAHERVCTVWIPIGDVPVTDGPVVVVEGSHRFADLVEATRGFDVVRDAPRRADLGIHPIDFARQRGTRLLTADFRAGDLALFGMFTIHGALDNHSPIGRVRLSCDVRWQPASLPVDARYFGPLPAGTTGAGYAELNGAKPLTEPWHIR
ncbi:MAG: phytanoyl-CoA dioxygenase family protein [Alphaproteobacteria bacterium]|nr:phytanoyl-CoA dioxygenase family protein [Alphaproteobacteria bacterium]